MSAESLAVTPKAWSAWPQTRPSLDYALLLALSVLAHFCVWLWFQQPESRPPSEPVPRVVELSLVRPAPPPPVVKPAPPPPQPVAPPKPAPRPKPKPKPKPAPKPKPRPTPPPPVQQVAPSVQPSPAPPAPSVAPAAPVAEAPPAPPVFVPATSKRKSDPPYPKIAQRRGWEGTVLLEVDVSENGRPRSVKVIGSSGRQLLDQAALRDVQSWLFNPATRDGKAVDSTMTVTFKFKLTKS